MLYYVQREVLVNAKMLKREILKNAGIIESIENQSKAFEAEVQEYIQARAELEQDIDARKLLVETLFKSDSPEESITPAPSDPHFHLLPTEWLKKWMIGDVTTFPIWAKRSPAVKSEVTIMEVEENEPQKEETNAVVIDVDETEIKDESHTTNNKKNEEPIAPSDDGSSEVVILSGPNDQASTTKRKIKTSLIGNKERLCPHHHLHIPAIDEMKIVSNFAFESIFSLESPYSSPESVTFLQQNLDEDLRDDNYRCSICYDLMISTRQQVLQEVEMLRQITAAFEPSVAPIKQPYYLARQASQLLKRYLARLEKQQQSNKIIEVTKPSTKSPPVAPTAASSSTPQMIDLVEDSKPAVAVKKEGALKNQTLDSFLAADTEPVKREDVSTVRKELFGDACILNDNLLCEAHHQPILDLEKKSILVSGEIWKLIQTLFPAAIAIPKVMNENDSNGTLCRDCQRAIEKVHSTNEEIKLMKLAEANHGNLQRLYKKRGKLQQVTNQGKVTIPLEFSRLRQAPLAPDEIQELYDLLHPAFADGASDEADEEFNNPDHLWEYYVIDKQWLETWRSYVSSNASSSSNKEIKTPALLTNRRLCCPHGKLSSAIHLVSECCSDHNYEQLLQQTLTDRAAQSSSTGLLDSAFTSVPLASIRFIPNLPEVEVITRNQWKQLVYHHTIYPLHQQQAYQASMPQSSKKERPDVMILDEDIISDNNHQDEKIKTEEDLSQVLFEVKLTPKEMNPSLTFQSSQWSVTPAICLDCTAAAIEQYYLRQQFYEQEGFTTFVIKDPLLMAQLLQSEQDLESLKVIFQDSEAIEEYLQTLVQVMTDNATQATVAGGTEERRTSSRTRASSSRKKFKKETVWLSARDTVGLAKLKIFQSTNVEFGAQQIYCARSITADASEISTGTDPQKEVKPATAAATFFIPLTDGKKTLQDYQILARDVLLVVDLHNQDKEENFDFLHDYTATTSQQPEQGFVGSIFSSHPAESQKGVGSASFPDSMNAGHQVIELLQEDSQASVEILHSSSKAPSVPTPPRVVTTSTAAEEADRCTKRQRRNKNDAISTPSTTATTFATSTTSSSSSGRRKASEGTTTTRMMIDEEDEDEQLRRILEHSKTDR